MTETVQSQSELHQYYAYDTGPYATGIKIKVEEDTSHNMYSNLTADLLDFPTSLPNENLHYNDNGNAMQSIQIQSHTQDQLDSNRWATATYDMNVSESMQLYNRNGINDCCDVQNNSQMIEQFTMQQLGNTHDNTNTITSETNYNIQYDIKPKETQRVRYKPYKCTSCGHESSSRCHLVIHMRTHTGEKPYSCQKCNYKSNHKSNLTRHLKTHTNANNGKETIVPVLPVSTPQSSPIMSLPSLTASQPSSMSPTKLESIPSPLPLTPAPVTHHSTMTPMYTCTTCHFKCDSLLNLKMHVQTHTKPTLIDESNENVTAVAEQNVINNDWQDDERPYMLQAINVVLDLLT